MKKEKKELRLEEESTAYSFDDYYTFEEFKDMEFPDELGKPELIDGIICYQGGATVRHEEIVISIIYQFADYLLGKKCKVLGSNMCFVLQRKWKKERNIKPDIGLKPDVSIVCNSDILKEDAGYGAPTIAVEVISKGTKKKDLHDKFEIYEENGVKEYWIVFPENETVEVYYLDKEGKYSKSKKFSFSDEITTNIFADFKLRVNI